MASNLVEKSKWQKAKAAFHSIDWTSHTPLPVPRINPIDIFFHPFNANIPEVLWGPETIYASLSLRCIISTAFLDNSMDSFTFQKDTSLSASSLATSVSSPSSFSCHSVLEEPNDVEMHDPSVSCPSPISVPESPSKGFILSSLFARPATAPPVFHTEMKHVEGELCDLFSSNNAVTIKTPKGKGCSYEYTKDEVKEPEEAKQKRWNRYVAREHWLRQEAVQHGESPSRIQDEHVSEPVYGAAILPTAHISTPLEHQFFFPFSAAISSTDCVAFNIPTDFGDVLTTTAKATNTPNSNVVLEEISCPGHVHDSRSLANWMVDELDSPAEEPLLRLATSA